MSFFFQAEDGIRDATVTGVQTCALPISDRLPAFMLNDTKLVNRRLGEVEELFPIVKHRAGEKAGSLSGGQQRLVEFARSLRSEERRVGKGGRPRCARVH